MPKLSIIIPVYNEAGTLLPLITKVLAVHLAGVSKELVFIDDASTDSSASIILAQNIPEAQFIQLPKNEGKGSCVRRGIKAATGDIILVQDADLEYDPANYPELIAPILNGQTNVVFGSRFLNKNNKFLPLQFWANKLLTALTNLLYKQNLTDMETCYKVVRASLAKKLSLNSAGFEIEAEFTAKIARLGEKIVEVPVTFNPRTKIAGKKIRAKDALKTFFCLLKYRSIQKELN